VSRVLDRNAIAKLFDPAGYLGASGAFLQRALARHP